MSRWLDPFFRWRDGLLSDAGFQRWAARSPLTRGVARGRARQLFDLCSGFVYTQILLACVEFKVFDMLKNGPVELGVLAKRLGLELDRARRLCDGAVALGLMSRRGGERYGLGQHGAALLGNPGVVRMIEHNKILYRDLADPVALLKGQVETDLSKFWPYAIANDAKALSPGDVSPYTTLMSNSNSIVADEILDSYAFEQHRVMLDVGGGDGSFLLRVSERAPTLSLMLFDLPAVCARAKEKLDGRGLTPRVTIVPGNFATDDVPQGADLITLLRVIHDHDDEIVDRLLASVRAALPPGGALLIAEPLADTAGAETMGDAYFSFYLMAMGSGRPRSESDLKARLARAGFSRISVVPTRMPLQTSLLVAKV